MTRSFFNILHERWANLHPFLRFLSFALVLAALGLFGLKPSYRVFKQWRLEQNLQSAQKAVDESRMNEARDLSLTVLRGGDPRIDAFRILEKSTLALKDSRHAEIARALISHPESSDEDRLKGFQGIVMDLPLGLVGQAWAALPENCQQDPRFAVLFGERLIASERFNEAASVLLGIPEEKRDGRLNRCLVRVLIGSGRKEGFDEAQRMIASGFTAAGPEQSEWLDLLEQIPPVSLQENLLTPVRKILTDPPFSESARGALMLMRITYASQFGRRAEVLQAAIDTWKEPAPLDLARFLSDLGLAHLLLATFPAERVAGNPELFPIVLAALKKTAAWSQVPPLLDAHRDQVPKAEELAHRAIAATKTSDSAEATQAWTAAIAEAKSSPTADPLLKLQKMAAEAGMPEESETAMVEAIRLGRGPLPLYSELRPVLASLQEKGKENILLEICAIYLSFEPGNPVLLTQYAYLACLNNLADPATVLTAIVPMAEAFPKQVPIQCVLATVYLCAGQHEKAAETLAPLKLQTEQLSPAYRVALLTTQVLNAQRSKDDPQITEFPWKSLLPSERRKFSELLRGAGQTN